MNASAPAAGVAQVVPEGTVEQGVRAVVLLLAFAQLEVGVVFLAGVSHALLEEGVVVQHARFVRVVRGPKVPIKVRVIPATGKERGEGQDLLHVGGGYAYHTSPVPDSVGGWGTGVWLWAPHSLPVSASALLASRSRSSCAH